MSTTIDATSTTDTDTDTAAVLAVLHGVHDAVAAGDARAAVDAHAGDAAVYDLAPPLVAGTGSREGDVAALQAWIDGKDAPPVITLHDPVVHVGGDVALVFGLARMSGSSAREGGAFSFWFRVSYGLRRAGTTWRIVHRHESVPFRMDGTFLAALDLRP